MANSDTYDHLKTCIDDSLNNFESITRILPELVEDLEMFDSEDIKIFVQNLNKQITKLIPALEALNEIARPIRKNHSMDLSNEQVQIFINDIEKAIELNDRAKLKEVVDKITKFNQND